MFPPDARGVIQAPLRRLPATTAHRDMRPYAPMICPCNLGLRRTTAGQQACGAARFSDAFTVALGRVGVDARSASTVSGARGSACRRRAAAHSHRARTGEDTAFLTGLGSSLLLPARGRPAARQPARRATDARHHDARHHRPDIAEAEERPVAAGACAAAGGPPLLTVPLRVVASQTVGAPPSFESFPPFQRA